MSNDVIITSPVLTTALIVVDAATVQRLSALEVEARSLTIEGLGSLEKAEATLLQIVTLVDTIHKARMELTRPLDDIRGSAIEAERTACAGVISAKCDLSGRVAAYRKAMQAAREEAERAERIRAEREAQATRQRLAQEAAERAAAQQAEAALFDDEGTPPPPPPEPPPVVVAVTRMVDMPPAPPPSIVGEATRKRLRIVDPDLIPVKVQGVRLLVPDEKAIDKVLRAGIAVPGCELESYEVATVRRSPGRPRKIRDEEGR